MQMCKRTTVQNDKLFRKGINTSGNSWLRDGHARVQLVSPLAVVVRAVALRLALQAQAVLLLGDAAPVIKGNAGVLLRARIVGHFHHALLVLHNIRVGASCTRVLLDACELLVSCCREGELRPHVQERAKLVLSCNGKDAKCKRHGLHNLGCRLSDWGVMSLGT